MIITKMDGCRCPLSTSCNNTFDDSPRDLVRQKMCTHITMVQYNLARAHVNLLRSPCCGEDKEEPVAKRSDGDAFQKKWDKWDNEEFFRKRTEIWKLAGDHSEKTHVRHVRCFFRLGPREWEGPNPRQCLKKRTCLTCPTCPFFFGHVRFVFGHVRFFSDMFSLRVVPS